MRGPLDRCGAVGAGWSGGSDGCHTIIGCTQRRAPAPQAGAGCRPLRFSCIGPQALLLSETLPASTSLAFLQLCA